MRTRGAISLVEAPLNCPTQDNPNAREHHHYSKMLHLSLCLQQDEALCIILSFVLGDCGGFRRKYGGSRWRGAYLPHLIFLLKNALIIETDGDDIHEIRYISTSRHSEASNIKIVALVFILHLNEC